MEPKTKVENRKTKKTHMPRSIGKVWGISPEDEKERNGRKHLQKGKVLSLE